MATTSEDTIELAYDVLGLEALFLVPRIFSLLSLNPYFGTLVSATAYQHCSSSPTSAEQLFPCHDRPSHCPFSYCVGGGLPGPLKIAARRLFPSPQLPDHQRYVPLLILACLDTVPERNGAYEENSVTARVMLTKNRRKTSSSSCHLYLYSI